MRALESRLSAAGLLLLSALAATAMLLLRGPSCGHDFDFHLVSWLEVARAWHTGVFYPHWAASDNYGAGEPRFVFYPPGSWMLGAVLGSVVGWHTAPWLFTLLCFWGGGLSMYAFSKRWLPSAAALAAGCLYVVNPYALFVAYERTAYAELMAAALIPLLLRVAVEETPRIAQLSCILAAIWLTNAPSAVIACYTLLLLGAVRAATERQWQAPLRVALGTALGLSMSAFYLVPAAYEQRWVEIARAIGAGMRYQDSFLFHKSGEPFHDQVLLTASIIACILGALSLLSVALWRPIKQRRSFLWVTSLVPVILCLLLPVSAPVWQHAPKLAYVQFPWRWLLVLAPITSLMLAGAVERVGSRLRVGIVAGMMLLSIGIATPRLHQYCDEQDNVSAQLQLMHDGDGQEGTDEYTPRDVDNSAIAQDQPDVRVLREANAEEPDSSRQENPEWTANSAEEVSARIAVQRWQPEDRVVRIDSAVPGYALIRLLNYPAWSVHLNGQAVQDLSRRADGMMVIPVSPGQSKIDIHWRTTGDVWTGRCLSGVGVLVLVFVSIAERRRIRPATPQD